jgi:hypothetical protein
LLREEHGRMCCKLLLQALWLRIGSFVSNVFAYNWMIFKVCNWVDLEREAASSFLLSLFRSLLLLWILCAEGRILDCFSNDLKMPFNINPPICISESTLLPLYLKKLGNEIKVSLQPLIELDLCRLQFIYIRIYCWRFKAFTVVYSWILRLCGYWCRK